MSWILLPSFQQAAQTRHPVAGESQNAGPKWAGGPKRPLHEAVSVKLGFQ